MSNERRSGSAVPGIILIVIGAVFLANTLDLVDIGDLMRHVWRYWPLILIAIGVKLVRDSQRRKTSAP